MKCLSENDVLSLKEILYMETNSLIKTKAMHQLVQDDGLKREMETAILANEGRIKGIQQFISENQIIETQEEEE